MPLLRSCGRPGYIPVHVRRSSGDQPHESNYSKDGQRIYHAHRQGLRADDLRLAGLDQGERIFQIVDAETFEVTRRVDMREQVHHPQRVRLLPPE